MENISDNGAVWSYKLSHDGLITMSSPTGQSYTAKLNGGEAPMKGNPGITSVFVKTVGANTLEETDKRGDKVIGVFHMTVSADGKQARVSYEDKVQNRTQSFVATKQ
jgi:hypothetical protein